MALNRIERRRRVHYRIRKHVNGTAERPRMVVFRSNKQIYVQVVDDQKGVTLVAAASNDKVTLPPSAKARLESRLPPSSERRSPSVPRRRESPLSLLTVEVTSITVELKVWPTLPVKVALFSN